ncbi:hypothetical protein BS630_26285 [Rhizobium laguerreae]|nr:hypothetical protein BS630_26285 [Rhizobium laguerreae]
MGYTGTLKPRGILVYQFYRRAKTYCSRFDASRIEQVDPRAEAKTWNGNYSAQALVNGIDLAEMKS